MISHTSHRYLAAALWLTLAAAPAFAQGGLSQTQGAPSLPTGSPFLGSVPQGTVSPQPIALSVADAIHRALQYNLGVLEAEQGVDRARGARWLALSGLLPNISGNLSAARQTTNLEAFGFPISRVSPDIPTVIGPFDVFDARIRVSQSIVDLAALNRTRAESANVAAAQHLYRSARDFVVLVSANAYLQTLAASARADTARAQRDTAQALYQQAQDLRQSGIVAGLDVVRAEVRLSADRQRATATENEFQKAKLQLARVIGLPIGQEFTLRDQLPTVPVPEMTLQDALDRAYRERPDYLAAQERVRAAEAEHAAARSELLPSFHINADYGKIGLTVDTAKSTFNVSGSLVVPIFQGGRTHGEIAQTEAELRNRRNEAENMRTQIYYDVRSAFLDLQATGEQLQTATRERDLANQQLTQSRDRFAAGVADNIEVVQAQEAVTLANEQYIGALYGYNVSKAVLAESLGTAESAVERFLGGSQP